MVIERYEIRLLELPLVEPFRSSNDSFDKRQITVIGLESAGVIGWGECAGLPTGTYHSETASGTYQALPRILEKLGLTNKSIEYGFKSLATNPLPGRPMATAAIEMALIDLQLKLHDQPLIQLLSRSKTRIETARDRFLAGATVGVADPQSTADKAVALTRQGYRRIKFKIKPGHDLEPIKAVLDAVEPEVEIHVDANASYGQKDIETFLRLAQLGVTVFEQPFPVDDVGSAQALCREFSATKSKPLVLADEAASDLPSIQKLAELEALNGIVLKPSRLGGLHNSIGILNFCSKSDLPAAIGGMLETGLGRHSLASLAALEPVSLTGDISPASRWLKQDPWPDLHISAGNDGMALIDIPTTPGVAPPPDQNLLQHYTMKKT